MSSHRRGAATPKIDSFLPSTAAAGSPARASFPNSRLVYDMRLSSFIYVTDFNSQLLRNTGFTYLFASLLFVNPIFFASHNSLPGTRAAMAPSTIHSVYGPAMLKLEHAGSPPLQARIQSRWCPGDRVSNCGGSLYSAHLAPGISPTPSPRPLVSL